MINPLSTEWSHVRVDWLMDEVRQAVSPEQLAGREVFHYSIPALTEYGDGIVEDGDSIASSKPKLRGGELLVSKLNPRKSHILVARAPVDPTVCSGEFIVLRPRSCDVRFMFYVFASEVVRQELSSRVQSVTKSHQRVGPDDIAKLWVRVPNLETQRRIANFLDSETARIDLLVGKKRALLERLVLRSMSKIHVAVRGADEGIRIAHPSGLDWLGPARREWPTSHIGLVADLYPGVGFPDEYQGEREGDFPLLKASDLGGAGAGDLGIDSAANWVSAEVAQRLRGKPAPIGTIVFPRIGAALNGRNRRILRRAALFDNNLVGIRFREGDPEYWARLLLLLDLGGIAQPGPVPSVGAGQLAAVRVPLPPPEEQTRIARRLRPDLERMETLRAKIGAQLQSIGEHRRALITAAVTGRSKPV